VEHEVGDLLTAVVELARFLKVDAEECLQKANDRFEKRFRYMEKKAKEMGRGTKGYDPSGDGRALAGSKKL
jgi:tetrapyrrole methylase family protein / MazG family protein